MKQCRHCKEIKDLKLFGLCNRSKDKLNGICKECNSENSKQTSRSISGRFSIARSQATIRGLEFSITREFHAKLLLKKCYYCNNELDQYGSAMDRIDNSKGYTETNVVPCCGKCNVFRANHISSVEMKIAMNAIIKYRAKNKQFT